MTVLVARSPAAWSTGRSSGALARVKITKAVRTGQITP